MLVQELQVLKRTVGETREGTVQQELLISSLKRQNQTEGEDDEVRSTEQRSLRERQSKFDAELPRLHNEILQLQEEVRQQREDVAKMQADVSLTEVGREAVAAHKTSWEGRKTNAEKELQSLQKFMAQLTKDIEDSEKKLESEKASIEAAKAEKDSFQTEVNLIQLSKTPAGKRKTRKSSAGDVEAPGAGGPAPTAAADAQGPSGVP